MKDQLESNGIGTPAHATTSLGQGGVHPMTHISEAQRTMIQLLHYWNLLRARWVLIVVATVGTALAVGLYTKFFMQKIYRAETVITPVPVAQSLANSAGMGGFEGMGGGVMSLFGFGGDSDNTLTAQRYIAIMRSYSFTTELARRYGVDKVIAQRDGVDPASLSPWKISDRLKNSIDAEYDYKTGNLTVYYLDPSPPYAKQMLTNFLESLRDKVRSREIKSATTAAESLRDEVSRTPDAILQNQLYELLARQIQRAKLAQVEADFAFKIVEPPLVPEKYYSPVARSNAILAGALVFVGFCGWIIAADLLRRARVQLLALEQVAERIPAPPSGWTIDGHDEPREQPSSPSDKPGVSH
ncbi:MAG: Wzz/FepE/Etk N-terminal domain-containing protein [Candidatus Binataceae bacterium]